MTAAHKVTKQDFESKFRELKGEVGAGAEQAKSYALAAAAVVVVGIAAVAFLAGRRRGKRKTTVVEIRRI